METPSIQNNEKDNYSNIEMEYREIQSMKFALMGGTGIALICSILWAAITVITEYQIGFMAIAVGLAVGFTVQYLGKGVDVSFRIIGSLLSLISCILGNAFSMIWFASMETGNNFFATMLNMDYTILFEAMIDSISGIDLLFYGFAIYEAYRFSVVNISDDLKSERIKLNEAKTSESIETRSRLSLVSIFLVLIAFFLPYFLSSGVQSFYYDSGELLSEGNYRNGMLEGEWKYYYKDGTIKSIQNFENDLNTGKNIWYYENGNIEKSIEYSSGLMHGMSESYYEKGQLYQKGMYEWDRMTGQWLTFYENGEIFQEYYYKDDNPDNKFIEYYMGGHKKVECNYKKGVMVGNYQFWDSLGVQIRQSHYKDGNEYLIYYRDLKGKISITDGNGPYTKYYPSKKKSAFGYYKDSLKTGTWEAYYEDGKLMSRTKHKGQESFLIEWYDGKGTKKVINGNGIVEEFKKDILISKIPYVDGKISGQSLNYGYDGNLLSSIYYSNGQLHGDYLYYIPMDTVLYVKGYYKNNKRHGDWLWYHENGVISSKATFVDGNKTGIQEFYDYYGVHLKNEIYENGEKLNTEIIN